MEDKYAGLGAADGGDVVESAVAALQENVLCKHCSLLGITGHGEQKPTGRESIKRDELRGVNTSGHKPGAAQSCVGCMGEDR